MYISMCKSKCANTIYIYIYIYIYIAILRRYTYMYTFIYIYMCIVIVANEYHNDIYCYISSLHITYNTYIYTDVSTYTLAIYMYTLFSKQHNIFYLTFKVFLIKTIQLVYVTGLMSDDNSSW